jgi:hypothetical protein
LRLRVERSEIHEEGDQASVPDPAEEKFLALARAAWRASNGRGKRALRTAMIEAARPDDRTP